MSATHRTTQTPNPKYRSLIVEINEPSFAANGGRLPAQGTLYGSNEWTGLIGSDYRKEFSNFVYVEQIDDTKNGGQVIFAPGLSDAEAATPFRTKSWFGNHRWPPVLKLLKFISARDFPLVSQKTADDETVNVYADRYLIREVYIPEVSEGTKFLQEEFISPRPFIIPQYPVPTPTSITYHYLNIRGGFPECLHKKINIADLISTTSSYAGGITSENYNQLKGQIFPATNFTEWAPYVISDTQELTGGVWYRKRIRVFPPPEPETISRTL